MRQTAASLSNLILRSVVIRLQLAPNLPSVKADAAQIHRVVQRLLINAAEAIGEADGTITIITELRQIASADLANAIVGANLPPGGYVAVQIADTGCGMDEAMLTHIFDPFFTTKFTGRGLSLSAVLGILRQHSGALSVQSTPGQGTRFTVFLASAPVQQATASTASRAGSCPVLRGRQLLHSCGHRDHAPVADGDRVAQHPRLHALPWHRPQTLRACPVEDCARAPPCAPPRPAGAPSSAQPWPQAPAERLRAGR